MADCGTKCGGGPARPAQTADRQGETAARQWTRGLCVVIRRRGVWGESLAFSDAEAVAVKHRDLPALARFSRGVAERIGHDLTR